jgi:hypothetical protein
MQFFPYERFGLSLIETFITRNGVSYLRIKSSPERWQNEKKHSLTILDKAKVSRLVVDSQYSDSKLRCYGEGDYSLSC